MFLLVDIALLSRIGGYFSVYLFGQQGICFGINWLEEACLICRGCDCRCSLEVFDCIRLMVVWFWFDCHLMYLYLGLFCFLWLEGWVCIMMFELCKNFSLWLDQKKKKRKIGPSNCVSFVACLVKTFDISF